MSYSPQGSPSKDEHLQLMKPVGEGGRGEKNQPQRHEESHLQSSAIPSFSSYPQKQNNPRNLQGTNNNSLQPSSVKVSDFCLSGYQDLKPQLHPPVTVPPQVLHSRENGLSNHQSSTSTQPNEQVAPVFEASQQQNVPKDGKSSSNTPSEKYGIPSSGIYQSTNNSLQPPSVKVSNSSLPGYQHLNPQWPPLITVPSSQGFPSKANDLPYHQSSIQPNEQAAPIQAPPQQNLPQDDRNTSYSYNQRLIDQSGIPSSSGLQTATKPENHQQPQQKQPQAFDPLEGYHKAFPENINPTLNGEGLPSKAQNEAKLQPVPRETKQVVDQQSNSHSQRERLPVPDGYPPSRPPTSPSKLEPPIVQPSKCCCCSSCCQKNCCSCCSIL